MTHSESIGKLAEALSLAQGEMTHASKDAENPAFKRGNKASTYADLASVIDALRGPFAKHGLSYVQTMKPNDNLAVVETTLLHSSGEWISSEIALPVQAKTPHGYGSAFTYARRYSLAAIAGVTQADDDGNAASGKAEPEAEKANESQVLNYIAAIEACDSMEGLKSTYAAAVKGCGQDQAAQSRIIAAKDARKAALKASKEVAA